MDKDNQLSVYKEVGSEQTSDLQAIIQTFIGVVLFIGLLFATFFGIDILSLFASS